MGRATERLYGILLGYALALPEAREDHPWGETVVKVRSKVFLFTGHGKGPADELGFSVKLPESGVDLLDRHYAEPTGYGLGKSGWVSVRIAEGERAPAEAELRAWVLESYRAVAPKRLVARLDAGEASP